MGAGGDVLAGGVPPFLSEAASAPAVPGPWATSEACSALRATSFSARSSSSSGLWLTRLFTSHLHLSSPPWTLSCHLPVLLVCPLRPLTPTHKRTSCTWLRASVSDFPCSQASGTGLCRACPCSVRASHTALCSGMRSPGERLEAHADLLLLPGWGAYRSGALELSSSGCATLRIPQLPPRALWPA